MTIDPHSIASSWLAAFASAVDAADIDALVGLFLPDGWLRDLLVSTWDNRSLEGREKIRDFLSSTLPAAQLTSIKLNETTYLIPRVTFIGQIQTSDVDFAFTFECARGHGQGYVRLLPDADGNHKAFTVLLMLSDLHGHEENRTLLLRDDLTGLPGRNMQNEFDEWVTHVETKPYALVVGAAQTGLQVAARFKQMNIPTLVIERNARPGDVWRKRYPSLTLHTPRRHHSLLYHSYPTNWPEYTGRDKLAGWLDQYAVSQDLVIWTSTTLQPHPKYDAEKHEWDVTVVRNGTEVKLRPAHIVLATGTLGAANIPDIPGQDVFRGTTLHSTVYDGPKPHVGKRVVVIGAGNSSIDICQDLVLHGAESVTMVQRSSTCVTSRDFISVFLREGWPEDIPLEVSDLRWASIPIGLQKKMSIASQDFMWESQKELHDKLRKGGVQLNMGPEGEGLYIMTLGRLGGFWQDKGGAELIADGRIKVKSGVSPDYFTEAGIVFNDGTELPADVVIYATGYVQIKESNRALFGDDVIERTKPVYGLDEEGELRGSYRPSGHPGLWFATGDFFISRFMSKILALQLKAIQLGLIEASA
ncbi:dimethylaniline monooxygenase (N-oxide-forming) [Lentinus tigrinus ALCF2SS1-7]|uniref:Dimethylaniline monooxygenase (N-oxide-forming) n=1 Tax=Lentinus tigrinus ALCF2SS1-6 TaxID=1328759 RepID=A0A5C2SWA3_9APHY|nr:dimethylaniline monooxygenase (N-oxide-forming) [Lentinus tigrinus ALCF2SS1-6]RPD81237.1 dimethylaniline monooxygenase (N-oxide-forming) [Lentinus tigrinus ALCF2SS1-7]